MFTVLDRISLAGSHDRPNEDSCGASGDYAWVIDTSIFPGTPALMNADSDAAWLADFASERLSDLAPQAADGVALLRHVMEEARRLFMHRAPPERLDFMTWPVGAMTLVRRQGDSLDVWTFADTTAFLRGLDGHVVTVGDAPDLRKFEMAKAAELLSASGCTPKDIGKSEVFQTWLAGRRERQKKGGGLALLGLDPGAADRVRYARVPCEDGTVILLTSDGFSSLVDLYAHLDAQALVQKALNEGLASLAATARHIETEIDPDGRLFPRFKVSDDATALLLRA
ncbi:protein phosphatase 2C domain-containing protein [Microvirga antarctica]|uniref:protein phosphatase 2C domain-containing protein n=1 Tax=Microvirga antarctica TaxID=2819233 RepID=UPI001B3067DC|nr:protein phosphatase 2C domain-containing protein [Microvirga antarctica]